MRDAQKQCLSLRQLWHYAYQHNVHALNIYVRVNIYVRQLQKKMNE